MICLGGLELEIGQKYMLKSRKLKQGINALLCVLAWGLIGNLDG
jgi:hypothetical protein